MKKENIKYIVIPLLVLALYFGYTSFFTQEQSNLAFYKSNYYNDCYYDKKEPVKEVELTSTINKNNLTVNDKDMNKYYEPSSCIKTTGYTYKNYLKLNNFNIKHIKGRNDQTYQVSYQEVLKNLEAKKNKTDFDKQIISSLKYYTNNDKAKQLIPGRDGLYQKDSNLIGPDKDASSGTYILSVNIDVAVNDIYKLEKDKKVKDSQKIVFDGLSMDYIKVGE